MPADLLADQQLAPHAHTVRQVVAAALRHRPRAVVLYGSLARRLAGMEPHYLPRDVDLLIIGDLMPETVAVVDGPVPCQVQRMPVHRAVAVARSLRYDPRPVALARLYGSVLARRHCINVVLACLLLGPAYPDFGIQQIEIDGRTDPRDYSVHRVLAGACWWTALQAYARTRRGPLRLPSDKLVGLDRFPP